MNVETKLMNRLGGWIVFNYEVKDMEQERQRLEAEFSDVTFELSAAL